MFRAKDQNYFTYITCNPGRTVLYTGVTNDLEIRIKQHYLNKGKPGTFAGKYFCYKLLYYERYDVANMAIEREKEIKNMSREDKFNMIKAVNPFLEFISF